MIGSNLGYILKSFLLYFKNFLPHCALETTGIEFEQGAMHNWLTTPLEYIIRDYIGFMSEKEHAQTNYRSNKQPPLYLTIRFHFLSLKL